MKVNKLLAALMLGFSGAVMASTENQGFYIGTGLGEAEANDASEFGLSDDTDTAYRFFGGYEFSRLLTAEVGYLDLGNYRGSIPAIGGSARTRFELDGFSIGLRPQLVLSENWYAQAQLGAFLWDAKALVRTDLGSFRESDDGEDAYFGFGIGRNIGSSWQVSGEWTRFKTDGSDVDFANLAMTYRIGR